MIPIRDTIPSRRVAWVVRFLLAINVAAFYLELRQGIAIQGVIYNWGVVPVNWVLSQFSDILKWPHCVSLQHGDLSILDNLVHQQTHELKLFVEQCWSDSAYQPVFRKFHHQPVGTNRISGPNHEKLAKALRKLKARNFRFSSGVGGPRHVKGKSNE